MRAPNPFFAKHSTFNALTVPTFVRLRTISDGCPIFKSKQLKHMPDFLQAHANHSPHHYGEGRTNREVKI